MPRADRKHTQIHTHTASWQNFNTKSKNSIFEHLQHGNTWQVSRLSLAARFYCWWTCLGAACNFSCHIVILIIIVVFCQLAGRQSFLQGRRPRRGGRGGSLRLPLHFGAQLFNEVIKFAPTLIRYVVLYLELYSMFSLTWMWMPELSLLRPGELSAL